MVLNKGTIITIDDARYVIMGRVVYEDIDYYAAYQMDQKENTLSGARHMCYDEEYDDDPDPESDESFTSMVSVMVSVEDEDLENLLFEIYDTRISLYKR